MVKCGTCKFWVGFDTGDDNDIGQCRINPPTLIVGVVSGWPTCRESDWCGDYQGTAPTVPPPAQTPVMAWNLDGSTETPTADGLCRFASGNADQPGQLWFSPVGANGVDRTTDLESITAQSVLTLTNQLDANQWHQYQAGGPATSKNDGTNSWFAVDVASIWNIGAALVLPCTATLTIT